MEKFNVKLADFGICYNVRSKAIKEFFGDFIVEDKSEITISIDEEEYKSERERTPKVSGSNVELRSLYKKTSSLLPRFNRAVIHGVAMLYGGKAILFTAPSGTGKTTHANLWIENLGDEATIINGDKPIVWAEDNRIMIYSSPWAGKERVYENISAKLGAIVFLNQSDKCIAKDIDNKEKIKKLYDQVFIPRTEEDVASGMKMIDSIIKNVPMFSLDCDVSKKAYEVCKAKIDTIL